MEPGSQLSLTRYLQLATLLSSSPYQHCNGSRHKINYTLKSLKDVSITWDLDWSLIAVFFQITLTATPITNELLAYEEKQRAR